VTEILIPCDPNFITLCQKYGYRPIPNVIDCDEFHNIVQQLQDLDREDTDLLTVWFTVFFILKITFLCEKISND
jgi:hypothetical protein